MEASMEVPQKKSYLMIQLHPSLVYPQRNQSQYTVQTLHTPVLQQ
jgi:hypothetical protein